MSKAVEIIRKESLDGEQRGYHVPILLAEYDVLRNDLAVSNKDRTRLASLVRIKNQRISELKTELDAAQREVESVKSEVWRLRSAKV